ncbi:TetR/AcrR family transcriptional regulator [Paractinoplanes rishiriensis]|uniref:TetR family transcriptional regulator n=1 Tax=Paractinoplanes rishiriensis TaxID=1050105 RepID=A0A919MSY7_9ACTN|nr:TetR/AcrR family transcriptional regulator C-terminal domain-containing protein [Actinoplanes rishiriensis]GIE94208.1 TetR family transcriptional regulator [Actinoplanes rishiriensis]
MLELLWGLRAAPTRGPKATLNVDKIAAAALAIADADGIEAVSMQRVAEALDFTKMSLYRHVSAKSDLIALMIELAVEEPPDLRQVRGGWRPRLERWAHLLSATWETHPWLPGVTTGDRVMGPREVGWVEAAIAALAETPLPVAERMDVVTVISGHLRNTHGPDVAGTQPWHDSTHDELLRAYRERFPALEALDTRPVRRPRQTREFGLRCILDGVARTIETARPNYGESVRAP